MGRRCSKVNTESFPCLVLTALPPYISGEFSFGIACSKVSIGSSVHEDDPNLRRIVRHIGDHIDIVNDLASYEKEKRGFETGKSKSFINLVHVIMKLEHVEVEVAKSMAYAWQLCMENAILEDLEALKRRDDVTVEEWKFIDVLTSVVMSRYSGKDTRVA